MSRGGGGGFNDQRAGTSQPTSVSSDLVSMLVAIVVGLCVIFEPLVAGPARWLEYLSDGATSDDLVARTYLRFLMSMLSGLVFSCDLTAPLNSLSFCMEPFRNGGVGVRSEKLRRGTTMAGHARMESLVAMVKNIAEQGVPGSYLEAGVWRGGMSIVATAALQVYRLDSRPIYICDSYDGLPRPRKNSARVDENFYHDDRVYKRVLSVGEQQVLQNFDLFGVTRDKVVPIKGYFVDSLPPLRKALRRRGETLAILRMDGDMYDSTVDILYNLYDLVQVGGYIIIDDYGWDWGVSKEHSQQGRPSVGLFGAKDAVLDFRLLHGIEDNEHHIHDIDGGGAWFRKAREIVVQRDRYRSVLAENSSMSDALMPSMPRTRGQVQELQARWRELDDTRRQTAWRQGLKVYQDVKSRTPFNRSKWKEVIAEAPADIPWHL